MELGKLELGMLAPTVDMRTETDRRMAERNMARLMAKLEVRENPDGSQL